MHQATLKARTYATDKHADRPSHVKPSQTWWYTHLKLRRAANLFHGLIATARLFTFLDMAQDHETLPRTTSPLEGGINAGIKDQLRLHRGLSADHAMSMISWHLYQLTENPRPPWDFVQPKHWAGKPVRKPVKEEPISPELYGREFSWEDGNGIQKGWSGNR